MTDKFGHEPAFPVTKINGEWVESLTHGLTKREWFARMAMMGICSSRDEAGELIEHGYEWIASESFKVADAMLKEAGK